MTTQIAREEARCRHMDYFFRLTAMVLLYAPSHRQDNTYNGLTPVVEHWLEREVTSTNGSPWDHDGFLFRIYIQYCNCHFSNWWFFYCSWWFHEIQLPHGVRNDDVTVGVDTLRGRLHDVGRARQHVQLRQVAAGLLPQVLGRPKRRVLGSGDRQIKYDWVDRWMDGRTDGRTDIQADDGWMDGWMDRWTVFKN